MAEYAMDMEQQDLESGMAECIQDHQLMQEEEEQKFWAEQQAISKADPKQFWAELTESIGKAVRGIK